MFARSTDTSASRKAEASPAGQQPASGGLHLTAPARSNADPGQVFGQSVQSVQSALTGSQQSAPAPYAPAAEIVPPPGKVSVIGNDLTILGQGITIISKGSIQLDGAIQGNLHGTNIVVGEKGKVDGLISAESVVIRGMVTGTIRAVRVALQEGAHVDGEIQHQTLTIDAKAYFDGTVRRPKNVDDLMPNLDPAAHDTKLRAS